MTVIDTDIFSDIMKDVPVALARLATIPAEQQSIAVVTAEEVMRGQLAAIRSAETKKGGAQLPVVYEFFTQHLGDLANYRILPYTPIAHTLFLAWRAAKVRIGTQDLRIAAIASAHNATLVTRNARDFQQVPGLSLDVWN